MGGGGLFICLIFFFIGSESKKWLITLFKNLICTTSFLLGRSGLFSLLSTKFSQGVENAEWLYLSSKKLPFQVRLETCRNHKAVLEQGGWEAVLVCLNSHKMQPCFSHFPLILMLWGHVFFDSPLKTLLCVAASLKHPSLTDFPLKLFYKKDVQ